MSELSQAIVSQRCQTCVTALPDIHDGLCFGGVKNSRKMRNIESLFLIERGEPKRSAAMQAACEMHGGPKLPDILFLTVIRIKVAEKYLHYW